MLFEKLESKEVKDSVILRKVYLNLAINFDRLGFIQSAKKCAKKLTFLASILLQNIALQNICKIFRIYFERNINHKRSVLHKVLF